MDISQALPEGRVNSQAVSGPGKPTQYLSTLLTRRSQPVLAFSSSVLIRTLLATHLHFSYILEATLPNLLTLALILFV